MSDPTQNRHDFAVALAVEAGHLAANMWRPRPVETKSPMDFCTEADRAVERLVSARRGGRAFLNSRRLDVSRLWHGVAPVNEVGWPDRRPVTEYGALLRRLVAGGYEFCRHGSGALAMAEVAAGLNDGHIELHINAWDALADFEGAEIETHAAGAAAVGLVMQVKGKRPITDLVARLTEIDGVRPIGTVDEDSLD